MFIFLMHMVSYIVLIPILYNKIYTYKNIGNIRNNNSNNKRWNIN